MARHRLTAADVGCWVIKTSRTPGELVPGWAPGTERRLDRCLHRTYRLGLMAPGQPCLLWLSGRSAAGVHAAGVVAGPVREDDGPRVAVRLTLLAEPVHRADLLADPAARDAEVLRMPAGSNPSWLSPAQYAAVRGRLWPAARLGRWTACAHTDTAGERSPGS